MIVKSMLVVSIAVCVWSASGCGLLDPYGPCPNNSPGTPVFGPPTPTNPDPRDPSGDNYANGVKYKKLADGEICTCGPYESGCYDTPEQANEGAGTGTQLGGAGCFETEEGGPVVCTHPPTGAAPDSDMLSVPWECTCYQWSVTFGPPRQDSISGYYRAWNAQAAAGLCWAALSSRIRSVGGTPGRTIRATCNDGTGKVEVPGEDQGAPPQPENAYWVCDVKATCEYLGERPPGMKGQRIPYDGRGISFTSEADAKQRARDDVERNKCDGTLAKDPVFVGEPACRKIT